jgi:hypothetical protein
MNSPGVNMKKTARSWENFYDKINYHFPPILIEEEVKVTDWINDFRSWTI